MAFACRDDALRASGFLEQAKEIHAKHPVCDGHNDLPWAFRNMEPRGEPRLQNWDLDANHAGKTYATTYGRLHTDLARLREGGVGWQFWSVFIPQLTAATPRQLADATIALCTDAVVRFEGALGMPFDPKKAQLNQSHMSKIKYVNKQTSNKYVNIQINKVETIRQIL